MKVEKITKKEPHTVFDGIAATHIELIPGGFLSSLGRSFLVDFYRAIAGSKYGFLIVAIDDTEFPGTQLGFIAGTYDTKKLQFEILRRLSSRSLFFLAFRMIFDLSVPRKIFELLLYPRKKREDGVPLPPAEIVNFCVDARQQGKGVGRTLFNALVEEFRLAGVPKIKIVTGANQRSAQSFYNGIGALRIGSETVHAGQESVVYTFAVPS